MPGRHKVLLVIPNLQQGGAERQILELMTRLPERFEPVLCLWENVVHYEEYLPPGQPKYVLGVHRMGMTGLSRLARVLDEERPAILHSYRDKANFWARLATIAIPVPIVLTSCRNQSIDLLHRTTEPFLSHLSDRVLTNSLGVRRELIQRARVRPEKIQVIPNFIDLTRFRPPTHLERQAARARFGLADDEIAIILPGRIGKQKNQVGLALALYLMKRKGALSGRVRVLLAGRNRDRLFVAALPKWLRALDVERWVSFLGPVKDMTPLYHAADVLAMPSLYEGLPNAVIEALASGVPAIVSKAANEDGLVEPGASGFEVPTYSPRALADALERIVAMSPPERAQMGHAGRKYVEDRLHPQRVLDETIMLYDRLLAEKGMA